MKPPTRVNHPQEVEVPADNRSLVAPVYQSVKFTFDTVDDFQRHARGEREGFVYSRVSNPTLRQLELTLAELQGRDTCALTASGVAAVNLAMLSLCRPGDRVMLFAEMYQPTRYMVRRFLARYGVSHTMLSIDDTAGIEAALAAHPTRLVVFESPSNPRLKIADIEAIVAAAKAHGALTILDNTFAGFHNHGQYDIDVFVHSLTKHASGHGDVMGGAIIGRRELIAPIARDLVILGPTLDPHAASLIQRGLKTYFVRVERQSANAAAIAQFLESHPSVARVDYPGLASHSRHALAKRQMQGSGTMICCELAAQIDPACFAESLKLFAISASLGSTESLVMPGQLMRPRDLEERELAWAGVTDRTIRLSVGLEDQDDLIEDIAQALEEGERRTADSGR